MADRITEEKLKNKRFRDTEEKILTAFFLVKDYLSIERIIKIAKISRSTLYRHHKNLTQVVPDYERYIIKKFRRIIQKSLCSNNNNIKELYQRMLIFIVANKRIAQFLFSFGDNHITLEKMIQCLQSKLLSSRKIANEKMLNIYVKEVAGVIEEWEKNGYSIDEISTTVNKIVYLTSTARARLGPITYQDKYDKIK